MKPIEVDAMSFFRPLMLRVRVRLAKLWRVRLGVRLIRVGAAIAGCGLEIEASCELGPSVTEVGLDGAGLYLKVEDTFPATIDHSGIRFVPDGAGLCGEYIIYRPEAGYEMTPPETTK